MMTIKREMYDADDRRQHDQIVMLLREAFGQEYEDFYEVQLETLGSRENTVLYKNDGCIVAHVQIVPYSYKYNDQAIPLAYLYAVCTSQKLRGKGIMSKVVMPEVLQEVYSRGYEGTFLCPSSESLVHFYERFGFGAMKGGAYSTLVEGKPLIVPGVEAQSYLTKTENLDSSAAGNSIELPLAAGWLLHTNGGTPIDSETSIVSPLT